ncbi:MAG TPA: aminotransferase class I/II-fold pyridoxal phosphate-dependent enzyme [Thermohalobaculum sp.]|nr:aminotransferase class I/II-fold pyridoxal phosphate-dependent enzyme [Thermohalobaculum sp.]
MGIKQRASSIRSAYGALQALGRDPTSLKFDRIVSPTRAILGNEPMMLFGTNNYLGLTFDQHCIDTAIDAIREFGAGTTGSRIANGTYEEHRALEAEIAVFYNKRATILYSTGYLANLGVISALAEKGDYLLIDADSHASIYDACKMSDAEIIRFRHNNPEDLAKRLARLEGMPGDKIIVVEGIYSMLGDSAPLAEIAAVKRAAGDNVYLLVDEAHSLGVMGKSGRGKCQEDDVEDDCDYIVGTFSKSVGTTGGYCVSNVEGFECLRSYSRPYMFTASLTPPTVATARAAFRRMAESPELRERLWKNSNRLYNGLAQLGFDLGPEVSPVVAVKLADPQTAVTLWNLLIDAGVYTNIAIPPATPNALSLLRVSVSAAHDDEQISSALEIFAEAGRQLGLISYGVNMATSRVA